MDIVTSTVTSADGTLIGTRTTGSGPAIVVVPGNNRMAHHYDRLAAALADRFTVCIIERRGRGVSGPQGDGYSLDTEIADLRAVQDAVGSDLVFGHSYGGLIALSAARGGGGIRSLAVYEPALSIDGSFDLSFLPELRALLARGKHVRAMALFFHKTQVLPFRRSPYLLCWALSVLMVGHRTPERDMMPTTPIELAEVAAAAGDGSRYASVTAETLLIGGTKSPAYLTGVFGPLARIIPNARSVMLAGGDHNAPDENAPDRVAAELGEFFASVAQK